MEMLARLANLPGALPGACAQGLIWGIMAIGVYLTYRILDVADLTVDGSFGTGGAVCVMCLLSGQNVWVSLLAAVLAGLATGLVTGLLHTFMGIPAILSGILTLAVLTLPVIISTAEESLRSVPDTYRQASLALGAGKAQTITRVVLPCAMPGMLTGAILGVARAAGETAAIMFTAAVFYTPKNPDSIFSSVMALPYHMYVLATAGTDIEKTRPLQYGTGLVLILLVLGMNLLAIILRDHLQRRHHA